MEDESSKSFEEIFWRIPKIKLKEAEERFNRYLDLAWRIYTRIERDPVEFARFKKLLGENEAKRSRNPKPGSPAPLRGRSRLTAGGQACCLGEFPVTALDHTISESVLDAKPRPHHRSRSASSSSRRASAR